MAGSEALGAGWANGVGHSKLRETLITVDREIINCTTPAIFDLLQSNYKPHCHANLIANSLAALALMNIVIEFV